MKHRLRVWYNMWLGIRWGAYFTILWLSSTYYLRASYPPETEYTGALISSPVHPLLLI